MATVEHSEKCTVTAYLFVDDDEIDPYEIEWASLGDTCWAAIAKAVIKLQEEMQASTPQKPVKAMNLPWVGK